MNSLYRTARHLTLAELVKEWAPEVGTQPDDMARLIMQDAVNGMFDECGPESEFGRSGLRFIGQGTKAGYVSGAELEPLASDPETRRSCSGHIFIFKEAVLAFALAHGLDAPSWWQEEIGNTAPRELKTAREKQPRTLRPLGRPNKKGPRILTEMRTMPKDELYDMKQAVMAARFDASESTCRNYREQVKAENGDK
jgi:hypothetical protein